MANPIERKVTQGQVEFWLGTNPLKMAIETLASVANGDWKPTLLNQDVLDTCNDCDYEEASMNLYVVEGSTEDSATRLTRYITEVTARNEDHAETKARKEFRDQGAFREIDIYRIETV